MNSITAMYENMGISPAVYAYGESAVARLRDRFDEIDRIAAFLDMPVDEFIDRHTRLSPDRKHLSLLEKEDGSCRWLVENDPPECLIDPVKPQQCRDFPEKWNFPGWQSECGGTFKEQ